MKHNDDDNEDNEKPFFRTRPKRTKSKIIFESDLKLYAKCPYAYYLKHSVGMDKIPRSAFATEALFFEHQRKRLFTIDEAFALFPDQLRAGDELHRIDEMSADELQTYLQFHSPEEFGEHLRSRWQFHRNIGNYAGNDILWSFDKQPFTSMWELRDAGRNYYRFMLGNGAPILGFINKDNMAFDFEGNILVARFPELRNGVIDDPSIWGMGKDFSSSKGVDLDKNVLVTLRLLAYCTLAHDIPHLRLKWKVSDYDAERWNGNPTHLDTIIYRSIACKTGEVKTTTRKDSDLDMLRYLIDKHLTGIAKKDYHPNKSYCNSCSYAVVDPNGKSFCQEKNQAAQNSPLLSKKNAAK